jgi:hypothetical protein
MKTIFLFLFPGFLFLGCSRHLKDPVVPVNPQITSTAKPVVTYIQRQAKEFPVQSNVLSETTTTTTAATTKLFSEGLFLSIEEIVKPNDQKIILELPEGESHKMQMSKADNQRFVLQSLTAERCFSLTFENDIFDMTDRYYTNGVRFEWTSPGISHSPLSRLLFTFNHQARISFSVYLLQNMYTPVSTKIPPSLSGNERPYAAYMIFGHRKETTDAIRGIKFTNDITFGVIGSYSLGSVMQQGVHSTLPTNDPPLGWETQINNDVAAGYRLQVEKIMAGGKQWQIGALAAAQAGTLYDNLMAGFRLEAGKNMFYVSNNGMEAPKKDKQKVKLNAFLQGEGSLIGYDATLQGGVFNHDNIYTLQPDKIAHLVMKAEAGVEVRYWQYGLELGQTILSPEYTGGKIHKWGRIKLNFYFR